MSAAQKAVTLTPTAIDALRFARDFGSPYNYRAPQVGGFSLPGSSSRRRLIDRLCSMGLLSYGHLEITAAGREALDRIGVAA